MKAQTAEWHNLEEPTGPRKPVRANGRQRYELLLDAAERLAQRKDSERLAIRRIAQEAGVPMASVYHYLPNPGAVSIALSQRYLQGLEAQICAHIPDSGALSWAQLVAVFNQRAVRYYRQHPHAQALILGSDLSATIRSTDLNNNRRIAESILLVLAPKFANMGSQQLMEIIVTAIAVGDAVFALSIAEQGEITDPMARESWIAVCGYLAARLKHPVPPLSAYSINIE